MIRWIEVGSATAPGGAQLKLMQRGSEFSLTLGGAELMNSRRGGSETALGEIACAQLRDAASPHVLVGGLGLGFTLRAVLTAVGLQARVTVAELMPEVIDWARGPLAEVFLDSLDDPRVHLAQADVADLIALADGAYDAILLDVDNGPGGLVSPVNDRLYDDGGLAAALHALKPAGLLAVWSAARDAAFQRRLSRAGFIVHEHAARSGRSSRGARHLIWIARARTSRLDPSTP